MHNKYFKQLFKTISKLPNVGQKTALKLSYHLALENKILAKELISSLNDCIVNISSCKLCGNVSEDEICEVCSNTQRTRKICLVENAKDIFFYESCGGYDGYYFVFDLLSDEKINELKTMINTLNCDEIIFGFNPSINSDAFYFFLETKLGDIIKITKIAQGIPSGVKISDTDTITLSKALQNRTKD